MSDYDIIFAGAGHNGLTAAAYLAKAGKKVLVLERKAYAGGGVVTRELTVPGYHHDEHSILHVFILGNPLIAEDELGLLSKYGLEYAYPETMMGAIFEDQSGICLYKDVDRSCESIAKVCGEADADAYRAFAAEACAMLPMFMQGLYSPPLPMGAFMGMLDQSPEGQAIFGLMQRSSLDIVMERFQSDKLRMMLIRYCADNQQMPDDLGAGLAVVLYVGFIHTVGLGMPIGGSGKLTEAMIKAIAGCGGEVRTGAEVVRITTAGGKATGVDLADGEHITAKDAVVSSFHPWVLRRFVEGVPEPVLRRGERVTQASIAYLVSHYALKEPIRYHAGEEVNNAVMMQLIDTVKLGDMLDDFDAIRRGRIPARRLSACTNQARYDLTRVPEGRGILSGMQLAPYQLEGHDPLFWDEVKEQEADKSLSQYRKFISNLSDDNIVARKVESPLDHERYSPNSFLRGDVHGCAPYFYQSLGHRPTPDLGNYVVPGIEGLYSVGPFMHPGGGVGGGGRAAAIKMMEDMGIDFDQVVR